MLFPIANTPLLDWTLKKLAKNKVTETILAINYMADAFTKRYGKKAFGMKISYSRDLPQTSKTPSPFQKLGTGGPIKRAEKLIGQKEPFLVLNGDILTNINYAELMKKHEASGATVTIALYEVEDPTRYGVVELTEKGDIIRFVEKPSREEAPSNMVNAGVYALNPEIFSYIKEGRPTSIEREIFPKLAEEKKLHGYHFQGYWTDIGKPEDYLKANKLLLDTEIQKEKLGKNTILKNDVETQKPCIIGENVTIGSRSKIGPYTAIGENVTIGKGVLIENSIIFPRTRISDFASVKDAIIGEAVTVGKWVKIESECIVGDFVVIKDKITLTKGVSVCPFKEITESVLTPKCLM
jgi:NDP-sugar pyrophosphorylase family protein